MNGSVESSVGGIEAWAFPP